jgi:hypothetical protein
MGEKCMECSNYHTTPRNIPEECRSEHHRDGSLKSKKNMMCGVAKDELIELELSFP